jgi:hypothetical protein
MDYSELWKRENERCRQIYDQFLIDMEAVLDHIDWETVPVDDDVDLSDTIHFLMASKESLEEKLKFLTAK